MNRKCCASLHSPNGIRSKIASMSSPAARKMEYVLNSFLSAIGSSNIKSTYGFKKAISYPQPPCNVHCSR